MKEYERIEETNGFYKYYLYPDDEKQLFHISKDGCVLYYDTSRDIEELHIPEGVTYFMSGAVSTAKFKKVFLPKSLQKLPPNLFTHNSELEEVVFDKECALTEIPNRCFTFCKKLKKVVLPPSIKTIGENAFAMCESLEDVNLAEGCISIKTCAFSNCISLKNFTIPSSVKEIADDAFFRANIKGRVNDTGNDNYKFISDKVIVALFQTGITKQLGIRVDHDGDAIIHSAFPVWLNTPFMLELRKTDLTTYFLEACKFAMGFGGYLVYCADKFNKYISDFGDEEMKEIFHSIAKKGPYDLMLENMGIAKGSENEKCFDYIISIAINSAYEKLGQEFFEQINILMLMNILYYAGITIVLR